MDSCLGRWMKLQYQTVSADQIWQLTWMAFLKSEIFVTWTDGGFFQNMTIVDHSIRMVGKVWMKSWLTAIFAYSRYTLCFKRRMSWGTEKTVYICWGNALKQDIVCIGIRFDDIQLNMT